MMDRCSALTRFVRELPGLRNRGPDEDVVGASRGSTCVVPPSRTARAHLQRLISSVSSCLKPATEIVHVIGQQLERCIHRGDA